MLGRMLHKIIKDDVVVDVDLKGKLHKVGALFVVVVECHLMRLELFRKSGRMPHGFSPISTTNWLLLTNF